MNIRDYGVPDSNNNKRAVCNYCGKNVSNFSRLKAHLGGVGVDATHCPNVEPDVKEFFNNELLGKKHKVDGAFETIEPASQRVVRRRTVKSLREDMLVDGLVGLEEINISVPVGHDFRGSLLQSELERVKLRVKDIRGSWKVTGCSVLVDGWTNKEGRYLLNVLVECPRGAIYVKSLDLSAAIGDADALLMVFEEIIEEVGENNVVQIISYDLSPCMSVVGKQFMKNHPTIFWTVCASHCLEFMIKKIGTLESNGCILNNAKTLTQLIHSHMEVLKRNLACSGDLIRSAKIRSTIPFLTLYNIVSEKEKIEKFLSSSQWNSSVWVSRIDRRRIANLVGDASFWAGANVVLSATIPLVRALDLIHNSVEPQLGYVYEIMDRTKEKIKEEFDNKKARYMPYWVEIDEIWNNGLHSPLHSAAFYLNPRFRYLANFCTDPEVNSDLNSCICDMVEEKKSERLVFKQIYLYATGYGHFGQEVARQESSSISPVDWWSKYGKECPELQTLAIRILS